MAYMYGRPYMCGRASGKKDVRTWLLRCMVQGMVQGMVHGARQPQYPGAPMPHVGHPADSMVGACHGCPWVMQLLLLFNECVDGVIGLWRTPTIRCEGKGMRHGCSRMCA
eukprot:scaffold180818_cov21-Tisochrysis_lutea.AAC.1